MKDYVNSAALQEYTTKLVAKLKTLFPGTPTAAATVAEMTDHNKTYVYVGTESGYTAGDWYYWNGTAWTSGGPFQATSIITDTTLAVAGEAADAKATGDAIAAAKTAVLNAMAPAYSTSGTYAVGDYVNHNGAIYRCTTAITTGEAWTAGHWVAVTLGADLEDQVGALNDIVTGTPGTNLFDGVFDESGYIVSGADQPHANFKRTSKYYPIVDTSSGKMWGYLSVAASTFAVAFYDENKSFIANKNYSGVTTKQNDLPNGAMYFRCYTDTSWNGNVTLATSNVNSYIPYEITYGIKDGSISEDNLTDALKDKINSANNVSAENATELVNIKRDLITSEIVNIFNGEFPESGYIDSSGAEAAAPSYERTDYIDIDNSNDTLYFFRTAQPYQLNAYFYDTNKSPVGNLLKPFSETTVALKASVEIPSNAKYIRLYLKTADYSGNIMLSYTEENAYIDYGEHYALKDNTVAESNLNPALKAKVNSNLALSGKTIAFMGDSIIGNFYDTSGICAIIAEKTGASVINCAFGGTRMAYKYSQYGDATPGASGYIDGATDQEKNQVDQYRYWNAISGYGLAQAITSGTWTLQDTAVANMTSGLDYFVARLAAVKAVDWSTVDFIMWEYGTNDFMAKVKPEGNDPFSYDYAYRQTIETLLTEYPNIRIITVTPGYRWYQSGGAFTNDSNTHTEYDYTGASHKLTDFVEIAETVSKEYQLPCIDNYYTVGANRFTRLAFFNSTDGTHPNAQGRERIASHISAQLSSLV